MATLLASGKYSVRAARLDNGTEPAIDFLDDLPPAHRSRMVRLFERLAAGLRLSREDFRKLEGEIFEFKDHRRRMCCFSTMDGWFVTHGFEKRTNSPTPRREIARAERIRRESLGIA